MTTYNVLDAKTNLSRLIEAVESGREARFGAFLGFKLLPERAHFPGLVIG